MSMGLGGMITGDTVLLYRGRRVLTGVVSKQYMNGTRMDSGHFRMITTVPMNARTEWWEWQGWTIENWMWRKGHGRHRSC